jgi:uncharacterized protein YqeY
MLKEKLQSDLKTAMKEKNKNLKLVVIEIRGAIKYAETRKGRTDEADDVEILSIIKKCTKECEETLSDYQKGGYEDKAEEFTEKLAIFKSYLPEEVSEEKLKEYVAKYITELDAQTMKDMGKVMKAVKSELTDLNLGFDAKLLADTIKGSLS